MARVIVSHKELHDKINGDANVYVTYDVILASLEMNVVKCVISDTKGRRIEAFGESNTDNLKSTVSKGYPFTVAQLRAFDRAAIQYLKYPDGTYSDKEIEKPETPNDPVVGMIDPEAYTKVDEAEMSPNDPADGLTDPDDYIEQPAEPEYIVDFGRNKGKVLSQCDEGWLNWAATKVKDDNLRALAQKELERRTK